MQACQGFTRMQTLGNHKASLMSKRLQPLDFTVAPMGSSEPGKTSFCGRMTVGFSWGIPPYTSRLAASGTKRTAYCLLETFLLITPNGLVGVWSYVYGLGS